MNLKHFFKSWEILLKNSKDYQDQMQKSKFFTSI